MEYFKKFFSRQIERIKNIREGSDLYFLFFRFGQIWTILATFYLAVLFQPISYEMSALSVAPVWGMGFAFFISCLVTVLLAELGLRCLDKNNSLGLYLGLILSFKYFLGWSFPWGIFGLYALLNPSSQQKYLKCAPPWFKDLLGFCKINYIGKKEELRPDPNGKPEDPS